MEGRPFDIAARARSFAHAFRGIRLVLASQHNAWIHAAATLAVLALGFALGVSRTEWALLVVAIALVWTAEALNTACEWICDVAEPEHHPLVGKAKDAAAGGVLLAAVGAVIIGLIVLGPKLLALLVG